MPLIAAYATFLLVTFFLVLQIFRFSTYHAYFLRSLALLISCSVAVGFALYMIPPFHASFFIQIWASAFLFFFVWKLQARRADEFLAAAETAEQAQFLERSATSTRAYYTLGAVFYLVGYAIAFLVFLNVLDQ